MKLEPAPNMRFGQSNGSESTVTLDEIFAESLRLRDDPTYLAIQDKNKSLLRDPIFNGLHGCASELGK